MTSPETRVPVPLAAKEKEHYRLTLEALADVDARRGISHERVKAWVASLGSDKPLPPCE